MLRFSDVSLKVVSDIEKYQIVETMIRGDFSMICKGYVETNNEFLKFYDPNKHISYVIYLDANSLYEDYVIKLLLKYLIGLAQNI